MSQYENIDTVPFSSFERGLPALVANLEKNKEKIRGLVVVYETKDGTTDAMIVGDPDIRILIGEFFGIAGKRFFNKGLSVAALLRLWIMEKLNQVRGK